ncbi:hypothetical protein IMG5_070430 [Ichthyophthirius multifiliis]|uniref:Uncharacterized protein n=1 Tax=Ichthyophthirius multifiliis TaxID=5932 RepID=G0QPQ6_ICHMU|nr:hypothetical protein IMG5_070430 [Ichthyophthirius multifiliis]EGR32771.1 hypothetical protein IMG5_070430 [Ichthyophthirius multifiliis]|eukprot:XP_004036757.1 hypothetical protein IMG5_070430 [Ichthyophthirius multifiliis]
MQGLKLFKKKRQTFLLYFLQNINIEIKTPFIIKHWLRSQTTGMKKKKDKKPKNLLKRNVKEGSPVEEEYIVEFLQDIQQRLDIFSDVKNLIQYLIYYDLLSEAEELNREMKLYGEEVNTKVKSLKQIIFEEQNIQLYEIYPHIKEFDKNNMKAFDIFLCNFDHVL